MDNNAIGFLLMYAVIAGWIVAALVFVNGSASTTK